MNYVCPGWNFGCPYYSQGFCKMDNPLEECDDYAYYNYEYEDEENAEKE